jgi:hypothetical protein
VELIGPAGFLEKLSEQKSLTRYPRECAVQTRLDLLHGRPINERLSHGYRSPRGGEHYLFADIDVSRMRPRTSISVKIGRRKQ